MSKNSSSYLGQEVTYNSDEGVVHVRSDAHGFGSGGSFGSGGTGTSSTPSPTLVVSAGSNLEFNLIWDSSVGSAPSGFTAAVINVAKYYESLFSASHKEIINLHVGWGELAGGSLPSGALGASESNGYLTNYATVTSHLPGFTFTASNEPTTSQFFITSAEAKSMGLISGTSTGVDGYMGFGTLSGTGYSWNFASTATSGAFPGTTASNQFDFQGVVQHEMAEVMGRIEMEGQSINGRATYTPLDLFNFSSQGVLALNAAASGPSTGGNTYFSIDNGATHLATFNDHVAGGDIADWASYPTSWNQSGTGLPSNVQDSYDAFAYPGVKTDLSHADLYVDESLGLTLTGVAIT